jgi:Mn2+/Fe2+ NRAMP family transporter
VFYGVYGFVVIVSAGLVLIPGAPLIQILYLSQALNAILLVPLLLLIIGICVDRRFMGAHAIGRTHAAGLLLITASLAICVLALGYLTFF